MVSVPRSATQYSTPNSSLVIVTNFFTLSFTLTATGILEKLSFDASCNVAGILNGQQVNGYMALDCVLGNTIGLLLAVTFVALVVTIYHAKHTLQPVAHGEESVPLIRGGQHKAGAAHV